MFYFHHYMSVALEGLFVWLVTHLGTLGLAGDTIDSVTNNLRQKSVTSALSKLFQRNVGPSFAEATPAVFFAFAGSPALTEKTSRNFDRTIRNSTPYAEDALEDLIRTNEYLHAPAGLAVPLVLLALTLGRFAQWEPSAYGNWLANAADDSYLDLIPPVLTAGLTRHFGSWWNQPWKDLGAFALSRYVIQQHQAMSYEKSWNGDRCILQMDGQKVFATGEFDTIGMGNPRLSSAIQILKDLGLLKDDQDDLTHLTSDGKRFLRQELAKEANNEIS